MWGVHSQPSCQPSLSMVTALEDKGFWGWLKRHQYQHQCLGASLVRPSHHILHVFLARAVLQDLNNFTSTAKLMGNDFDTWVGEARVLALRFILHA